MKFLGLLEKRRRVRSVDFFGEKDKIYMVLDKNKVVGKSENGFDFEKATDKKKN